MTTAFEHRESTIRYTFLSYMVLMVVLITLLPLKFQFPRILRFTWHFYISGIIGNLLLFMPLGFFFRMNRGSHERSWCLRELMMGLGVSFLIEFLQGFIPGRVTSGFDLIANALGTWAGAHFFLWVREKINTRKLAGVFALELPLMNLVYLLIPLLWLNGLGSGNNLIYVARTVLLGLMGTYLLISIYVYGIRWDSKPTEKKFALLVMGWFFLSAFPAALKSPFIVLGAGIAFGLMAFFKLLIPMKKNENCKRYELPTLQRVLPVFIIYLGILFFLPSPEGSGMLSLRFLSDIQAKMMLIFGFLERVGAMTVLGYLVAETRGRKNELLRRTLLIVFLVVAGIAGAGVAIKGKGFLNAPVFFELSMLSIAGVYGGLIYRIQLRGIKKFLNIPVSPEKG